MIFLALSEACLCIEFKAFAIFSRFQQSSITNSLGQIYYYVITVYVYHVDVYRDSLKRLTEDPKPYTNIAKGTIMNNYVYLYSLS
jgi:hypothetical protein